MPKYVKEENYARFRIIPIEKVFKIEERKMFLLGLPIWKTLKRYGEYSSSVLYFNNVEDSKKHIDEILKKEELVEQNLKTEEIYYP